MDFWNSLFVCDERRDGSKQMETKERLISKSPSDWQASLDCCTERDTFRAMRPKTTAHVLRRSSSLEHAPSTWRSGSASCVTPRADTDSTDVHSESTNGTAVHISDSSFNQLEEHEMCAESFHESHLQKNASLNPFSRHYRRENYHVDSVAEKYLDLIAADPSVYVRASQDIREDHFIASEALLMHPQLFADAPISMREDVTIAAHAVQSIPVNILYVGSAVKDDPLFWTLVGNTVAEGLQNSLPTETP